MVQAYRHFSPFEIISRAGSATADLVCAIAPHSDRISVTCGATNTGSFALEAAKILKRAGKSPIVTWIDHGFGASSTHNAALQRAHAEGVVVQTIPPKDADVYIDGLSDSQPQAIQSNPAALEWINSVNARSTDVVSIDIPTGLDSDSGRLDDNWVRASHTLNMLTLKPGLFMAEGRDVSGTLWLTNLGFDFTKLTDFATPNPVAWITGNVPRLRRAQASHKGTYGNVAIVGGASGMLGAAILAGTAALHAGAGRVWVLLLSQEHIPLDHHQLALMVRQYYEHQNIPGAVMVCGCGGGSGFGAILRPLLDTRSSLVLDADALNAVAISGDLTARLQQRAQSGLSTVLTPHPLEAARLLQTSVESIQADRLKASASIADKFQSISVLKGSGTVIAAPGHTPYICPTGNARLATAGTGDVLAGMIGAYLSQGVSALQSALMAAFRHGQAADQWPADNILTADRLARSPEIALSSP